MLAASIVFKMFNKPASSVAQLSRLLDQLREVLGLKHYSWRSQEKSLQWARIFTRWRGRNGRAPLV